MKNSIVPIAGGITAFVLVIMTMRALAPPPRCACSGQAGCACSKCT